MSLHPLPTPSHVDPVDRPPLPDRRSLGALRPLSPFLPFVLTALGTAIVNCVRWPSLFRSGEMWAEAGTHYFFHARVSDLATNATALDYAYVPALSRIVALAVEHLGFSASQAPWIYQGVALALISGSVASFSLPAFREWIRSDWARAAVCAGLACHRDYELRTFINAPYWVAIPFFLLLITLPLRRSLSTALLLGSAGFMALMMLSKPHFVSFAPALALWSAHACRERKWRIAAVPSIALAAACTQLLVLAAHPPCRPAHRAGSAA